MEQVTMNITLEPIKAWIKEFENAQQKYRSFGASDTEPDGIFQSLLDKAVHGKNPNVPLTGNDWELYASSMDCAEAAKALHDAAQMVVTIIGATPVKDLAAVEEYLREVCWRIY